MDIRDAILVVVVILNLALGAFILFEKNSNISNRWYAAAVFFAALWASSILGFRNTSSLELARLWMQFSYISALLIGATLFQFAFAFPSGNGLSFWYRVPFHVLAGLLALAILSPAFLVADILPLAGRREVLLLTPGKFLFGTVFFFFFFGAVAVLWYYFRRSTGILRTQYSYILSGVLVPGIFGVTFNLILPFFTNHRLIWLGPVFLFFMVAAIAYAMLKHHLFDIKVIATEVLTGVLLSALFLEVIVARSAEERILRLGLFILVSIFGYLLIRSVLAEVRQRERLQELTLALETANEDLKRLDKARREFVSIASHQLRTPLSAIKGFVSMILEGTYGKVAVKPRDALGKVYQSNERLIKLVNDLLDLSRIEAGRMQYEFQEVKFDEMVESVVDELKLKADEKKLRLTYTRPREALPSVWADPNKLRQVVMNLVDNAIKYTPEGAVSVTLKRLGTEARLDVADTGVGLEPEEKEHLFHMFHRGAGGQMYHTEGTGLGLYIAKRIIEDHKGRIEVTSAGKGKGAMFSLILSLGSPRRRDEQSTR